MKTIEFFGHGTTRFVIAIGGRVVKIARSRRGAIANKYEHRLYQVSSEQRKRMLCPALSVHCRGRFLISRRATPISDEEYAQLLDTHELPDWDYQPKSDDEGDPTECKAADWGRLDGRIVRVDYANVRSVWDAA